MKTPLYLGCIFLVLIVSSFAILPQKKNGLENLVSKELVIQDSSAYDCDTLYTAKGDIRLVQFVKADGKVVEYKSCYNLDGPVYVISANKVQCVKSAEGTMKFTRLAPGTQPYFAAPK